MHGNRIDSRELFAMDREIIIVHGEETYRMLVAIRDNVAKLKKEGRTRDEAVAAKPTAAFDAKWGQFVIDPGFFTRLVYEGV